MPGAEWEHSAERKRKPLNLIFKWGATQNGAPVLRKSEPAVAGAGLQDQGASENSGIEEGLKEDLQPVW